MSQADAAAFIARLKDDEAFRGEVMAAEGEERWRIVTDAGFDCTPDEVSTERERLTDDELGEIDAGWEGACNYLFICPTYHG
jgi:predicted ribosomally synthesized peptide with nif11-like leader